ncbi:hypothetical protein GCM10011318_12990 [Phaeocystidibacter marisrubri]|nr:hypothetical protein GCM10011318_12990 [Phaeocystidibacter marisrubri]
MFVIRRTLNIAVMRSFGLVVLFLFCSVSIFAQVEEDFDHNNVSTSESDCWEFDNATVSKPNSSVALNNGGNRPLGDATISGLLGESSITSPYIQFNGNSTIEFQHKLLNQTGGYINLTVTIIDPSDATAVTVLNHTYRFWYLNVGGNPTNTINESIPINYTGYGKVQFRWTWLDAYTNGYVDNISIDGTNAADGSQESGGYCPAYMEVFDTLCSATSNVNYSALYNDLSHSYNWTFTGASAGTIDKSISSNDGEIELDVDSISGDFILKAVESSSGHQTYYYIHINPLPTVDYDIDSICLEEPYDIELTLTGTAPWVVQYEYTGSGGTQSVNIPSSPYTLSMPGTADAFELIQVTDGEGCINSADFLPEVTVPYFPKPGPTGAIFH